MRLPPQLGSAADLVNRFERVKGRRAPWESYLADCFRYTAPNRDTFFDRRIGESRHKEIYDSTAIFASKRYVSRLQATIMPAWSEWSILSPGSDYADAPEKDQIANALENVTKLVFRDLNHSNFYQSLPESLRDMTISTGALRIDQGTPEKPFRCTAAPLASLHFEPGPYSTIENVWRCPKHWVSVLEREYPGLKLLPKWEKIKKENPSWEPKVIEGSVYVPEIDQYWSFVLAHEEKELLWSQLNGEGPGANPWVVFREDVIPGEVLGRGPAMHALNDILTANKVVEFELRNAALAVGGAWTGIADGVLNPYTAIVEPSVVIPVGSNSNTNPTLKPLERAGDFNVSNLILERLQNNIKTAFLNSLRRAAGPVKSATEISIDDRDLMMEEHASFGRLQTELVERVMARLVYIEAALGKIPALKVDGKEVTLKHNSPLSRVQDNEELQRIIKYFEISMATVGPETTMLATRMEDVPEAVAKRVGLPHSLLRDEGEKEQIKQQAAAAAQQMAQQAGIDPQQGPPTA